MTELRSTVQRLECENLSVTFAPRHSEQQVRALCDVDLVLDRGTVLGVVGESGSGKSTLAGCLVGLQLPTAGSVHAGDLKISGIRNRRDRRRLGREIGMVFQDPRSSLNPRLSVGNAIGDPLAVHRWGSSRDREGRVRALLNDVGLPADAMHRRVRELSGGQLQRVAIARALALNPAFVIADEPTSALDVSVQAQILNLLADLRAEFGFGMLLISHDLRVVRAVSDQLGVMLGGRIVEGGPTAEVFEAPSTDYTKQLIDATPLLRL